MFIFPSTTLSDVKLISAVAVCDHTNNPTKVYDINDADTDNFMANDGDAQNIAFEVEADNFIDFTDLVFTHFRLRQFGFTRSG